MKKILLFLLLSISVFAAKDDYFVSADWLKENLNNEKLLILDARGNKAAYMKGHITGAALTSWPAFSNMDGNAATNENWGVLKDKNELETSLQAAGLNEDSQVVIYTDTLNGFGEGARLLWMLKYVGFEDVRLLDGGIEAWKQVKGKTSNFGKNPPKGNFTIKKYNENLIISTNDLAGNLDNYSILDTREVEEHEGKKNYGESRNGMIPGSKNIFYKNFLDEDGLFRSKSEVEALITKAGLDTSKPIVSYCTGGIRSSMGWLAMTVYGHESINYDSSFAGWTLSGQEVE